MDAQKTKALRDEITAFKECYSRRHALNYHSDWVIALLSIVATAAISVIGIYNESDAARTMAIISIGNAVLLAAHRMGAFREIAEFQRLAATEAENLVTQLDYGVTNDDEFKSIVHRLQVLRDHTARNLPRGEGIQAAIDLRDELKKLREDVSNAVKSA